jgi:hypothetical protein
VLNFLSALCDAHEEPGQNAELSNQIAALAADSVKTTTAGERFVSSTSFRTVSNDLLIKDLLRSTNIILRLHKVIQTSPIIALAHKLAIPRTIANTLQTLSENLCAVDEVMIAVSLTLGSGLLRYWHTVYSKV